MHKVGRFDGANLAPHPIYAGHAEGLRWAPFVEHGDDTVHVAYGAMELASEGETEVISHAFEKALFVTEGEIEINRDGSIYRLSAGDFILVPTGIDHALRNRTPGSARWVEMSAPQPKAAGGWQDTWFDGPADWSRQAEPPDLRDPRTRLAGHYEPSQHPPASTVTSELHGFSLRMLMDANFGATHFNMFVVSFPDGGLCDHHDHPFEEAYFILDGTVDVIFDGKDYTLGPGDYGWTGVGAQHGFFPKAGQPIRWLEIQAPQPPAEGGMRWMSRWDYVNTVLKF
ncbi:MAG: cupin domain-containing protein [Alphaproteobacteria bacterium]|nr:cupin domain-containing protein [Alphaproteobacteria bacterium]